MRLSGFENKKFCDFQIVENLILVNFNARKMDIFPTELCPGYVNNVCRIHSYLIKNFTLVNTQQPRLCQQSSPDGKVDITGVRL